MASLTLESALVATGFELMLLLKVGGVGEEGYDGAEGWGECCGGG